MQYDFIIVGGGIVGLASAYQLLQKDKTLKLALLDKENKFAAHQTGHNSGVIHSGIYYKPGSLKAKNCITGYQMLLDFCDAHGVKYDRCGKIIVATLEKELPELEKLYQRGLENGLSEIKMLGAEEISSYEPHVRGIKGIHVPHTGIINYKHVCEVLKTQLLELGADLFTDCAVESIKQEPSRAVLNTSKGNFYANKYINCAGLYSDKVAAMTQKNIDTRIIPFRGEYYLIRPEKRSLVKNLIYPVPDPDFPFLGVHFTRMVSGAVEAGPNAVFAFKREGYNKWDVDVEEMMESFAWPGFRKIATRYWKTGLGEFYRSYSKTAFTKALQRLVPEIQEDDLIPAGAGVRAQACDRWGGLIDDFKIIEEPHAIHILNAPSPAATSSLSIGLSIAERALA